MLLGVLLNKEALYLDTVYGYRQFYNQSSGRYSEDDKVLFIYSDPWWISDINGKYQWHFVPTSCTTDEVVNAIKKVKPSILSVYPTYLEKIYEAGVNLKKLDIKLIVVNSEQSSLQRRIELSKIFDIPVLDKYSSEELTRISLECSNHKYHIEEDVCFIEIMNNNLSQLCLPGDDGIVVGTNLINFATPIIRYQIIQDESYTCSAN